ncbi:hypothetical protein [Nostoc sp.]|uniref:hypothetical protein n=1 Tax=Nostoc sp. TaxID=1180 RepID=UPI002FFA5BC6
MSQVNPEFIAQSGWRQGSILPVDIVKKLQENSEIGFPKDINESDLFLVVSHDCDVTNTSFETEPDVEIKLARFVSVKDKDASLFWGRNPRKFQFFVELEQLYEISIHERFFISRHFLLYNRPDTKINLAKDVIKQICLWLSKRYFRASFPDCFNNRITKKAQDGIRKSLKKTGEEITAIYISVCDEELQPHEVYEIDIKATIQPEAYENPSLRQNAQQITDLIASKLDECKGIEVLNNSVVSEAEVSIDDLRILKRWDYDFLSYSAETPDEIAPYS